MRFTRSGLEPDNDEDHGWYVLPTGNSLEDLEPCYGLNLIEGLEKVWWMQPNSDGCEACLLFDLTRHFEKCEL
jgi:hypothetical protein